MLCRYKPEKGKPNCEDNETRVIRYQTPKHREDVSLCFRLGDYIRLCDHTRVYRISGVIYHHKENEVHVLAILFTVHTDDCKANVVYSYIHTSSLDLVVL